MIFETYLQHSVSFINHYMSHLVTISVSGGGGVAEFVTISVSVGRGVAESVTVSVSGGRGVAPSDN